MIDKARLSVGVFQLCDAVNSLAEALRHADEFEKLAYDKVEIAKAAAIRCVDNLTKVLAEEVEIER